MLIFFFGIFMVCEAEVSVHWAVKIIFHFSSSDFVALQQDFPYRWTFVSSGVACVLFLPVQKLFFHLPSPSLPPSVAQLVTVCLFFFFLFLQLLTGCACSARGAGRPTFPLSLFLKVY